MSQHNDLNTTLILQIHVHAQHSLHIHNLNKGQAIIETCTFAIFLPGTSVVLGTTGLVPVAMSMCLAVKT